MVSVGSPAADLSDGCLRLAPSVRSDGAWFDLIKVKRLVVSQPS
jgi:hypothetical protein